MDSTAFYAVGRLCGHCFRVYNYQISCTTCGIPFTLAKSFRLCSGFEGDAYVEYYALNNRCRVYQNRIYLRSPSRAIDG